MKRIISLLIITSIFSISFSQENFKVIKVNGTIVLKTKNVSLETGTVFSEKEDLLFSSENATAAVINSQKGRLILTSTNHDLSTAGSNYLPSMYNISSRGVSLLNLTDLRNHFSGKYVVFDRGAIEMDKEVFPMDNDNFFFLRYIYKGAEINKKLGFIGDSLIIDKGSLYSVEGNTITSPDNTAIWLFYKKGSETIQVNQFDLIFPDMKQLIQEVQIILDAIKDKPLKGKIEEVNSYIGEFYGKIYRESLVTWMTKNFDLKTN